MGCVSSAAGSAPDQEGIGRYNLLIREIAFLESVYNEGYSLTQNILYIISIIDKHSKTIYND